MEDPEAKAAQEHLQQMFHDKAFTDFTINAANRAFPVHRAVLNRCSYFRGMLKHNFVETRTDELTLPESPEIVEAILAHIYGFPMSDLMPAIKVVDLMRLHTIADKYSLPSLVERTYTQWVENFGIAHPVLLSSVHLAAVFRSMNQLTMKTDVFEKYAINYIIDHEWISGVPCAMVIVLRAANPGLTEDLLREYISRASSKPKKLSACFESGRWQVMNNNSYLSMCPHCRNAWLWQKFDFDRELACPHCAKKHSWIEYVLEAAMDTGTAQEFQNSHQWTESVLPTIEAMLNVNPLPYAVRARTPAQHTPRSTLH